MNKLAQLSEAIHDEAKRAASLHAPMNSHHEAYGVIREEFESEYWPLVCLNPRKPMVHPTKGYELTPAMRNDELREELIQTAAMCLRALHDLC